MNSKLILADDHTVLRVGLKAFLEDQPGMEVVAECASGEEAVEATQTHGPDLLLIDLSMPGLGGIGAILEIRRRGLSPRILVLSQHADPTSVRRALEAGANGYVVKTARGEELITAVRAVLAGGTYIDPTVAASILTPSADRPVSDDEAFHRLSPRERQVLRLVAEGYSNKEIATALDIAVKTAMAHRANLMEKLNIHNRSKLVQFAIRMGVTQVSD